MQDIEEILTRARAAVAKFHAAQSIDNAGLEDTAADMEREAGETLVTAFSELDGLLMAGAFLPKEWRQGYGRTSTI